MVTYLLDDSTAEADQARQLLDDQRIPHMSIHDSEAEEPTLVFEGRRYSGLAAIKAAVRSIKQQKR